MGDSKESGYTIGLSISNSVRINLDQFSLNTKII